MGGRPGIPHPWQNWALFETKMLGWDNLVCVLGLWKVSVVQVRLVNAAGARGDFPSLLLVLCSLRVSFCSPV